jgi:hypothetical protein
MGRAENHTFFFFYFQDALVKRGGGKRSSVRIVDSCCWWSKERLTTRFLFALCCLSELGSLREEAPGPRVPVSSKLISTCTLYHFRNHQRSIV